MSLNIAICNNRKLGGDLRDMLSRSEALQSVRFMPVLLENGDALLETLRTDPGFFDTVLLSTTISGTNSLETARALRRIDPEVPLILTAPNGELAADAFGVFADGYLIRPYSQTRLDLFLRRAVAHCGQQQQNSRFYVKVRQDYVALGERDLVFAESSLKYLLLHMVDGSVVKTMMTLDGLRELLHGPQFLISHKSFLVNMDYVTDVQPCEFTLGSYGIAAITQRRYPQIRNQYLGYVSSRENDLCNA